jgi:hypothetical protein
MCGRQFGGIIGADRNVRTWNEGKCYASEWRQSLRPGDIRALPYLNALAAGNRRADPACRTEIA